MLMLLVGGCQCCVISSLQPGLSKGIELHHWLSIKVKLWQHLPLNNIHLAEVK